MEKTEKVTNLDEARLKAEQRKSTAQKIVEKHMTTGKKLTQQEALTILAEMCNVVNNMETVLSQLMMRFQSMEYQSGTTSAANIALHKLLEKKKVFTDEEFKGAWEEFVEKPMKEAHEKAQKAQEDIEKKMTEQAKEDSLDAAKRETTDTVPGATEEQKPEEQAVSEPVSEGK